MRGFLWNYLEKLIARMEKSLDRIRVSIPHGKTKGFRVMAYQLPFEPIYTVEKALEFVDQRIREISKYNPHVVAFPRYTGNLLMGIVPLSGKKLLTEKGKKIVENYGVIFRSGYISMLRKIAISTESVVVGGTILLSGGREEYYVVSGNGDIVASGGLKSIYKIFKVEDVVCSFMFPEELRDYREVRKFMEDGGRVVFTSEVLDEPVDDWKIKTGIWARSQSLGVFGVNSSTYGNFLGRELNGITFVSSPAALTKRLDGFVVRLTDPRNKGIAIADLDFETLEEYIRSLPKNYKRWTLGVR